MGKLGAHVSVAGGLDKAFERGETLRCEAIQIFTKNQRQWKAKPLETGQIDSFKAAWEKSAVGPVVVHDSYLINLANPDDSALQKSREAFLDEVLRAEMLGCTALVFHPGAHLGSGVESGLKRISESLNWVLERSGPVNVKLLIENTAGAGTHLGSQLNEIKAIFEGTDNHTAIGVCWDTAHGFAAGYGIHEEDGFHRLWEDFDVLIGLDRLQCFHLNDSKAPLGSHVDRHEEIGIGLIGENCFRWLVKDSRFESLPMIIEIPGDDACYEENLKRLHSYYT